MLATLRWLLFAVAAVAAQCPEHSFLGCVLRLKAQRVPFERNMMNLVFGIKTEAKLLHTCKAYSSILPCFREKINDCGDDKQRRLLNEVGKMLMYMCSPFSLKRQRMLIEHQECVSGVLGLPASTGCKLSGNKDGDEVLSCKRHCSSTQLDFLCTMKVWISEQNVCTVQEIEDKCGTPASEFYKDMQRNVFDPEFPVICERPGIQGVPVNISSSTADSIVIDEIPTTTTVRPEPKLPEEFFNQRSQERKFNVVVTPSPFSINSTTMRVPTVWTKFPGVRKTEYNKEGWRKKQPQTDGFMAFRPAVTATLTPIESSSPKSYKVINILKSLLPQNLPDQLSSLFEKSLEKHSYNPEDHYHTPGSPAATTRVTTEAPPVIITSTTLNPVTTTETPTTPVTISFHPGARRKPIQKWKPWYLGGPAI